MKKPSVFKIKKYLQNKNFFLSILDLKKVASFMVEQMKKGLRGEKSSLAMLPSFYLPDKKLKDGSFVVLEMGGTFFRGAKAKIKNQKVFLDRVYKSKIPGLDKKLTPKDFFKSLIKKAKPVLSKDSQIGFTFAFPIKNLPGGDAQLLYWDKGVNVPNLVGKKIGQNFVKVLKDEGFGACQVILLNDAVATLLAGLANKENFESVMGLVVATGTNCAYIEDKKIINLESGNLTPSSLNIFSSFDEELDRKSENPGVNRLEKMTSGKYCPELFKIIVRSLVKEKILPKEKVDFEWLKKFNVQDMDDLLMKKNEPFSFITQAILERSASLVAVELAGPILKKGFGKSKKPLIIVVEGSFYWKAPRYHSWVRKYLAKIIGERNTRFLKIKNSGLLGAAIVASLIRGKME